MTAPTDGTVLRPETFALGLTLGGRAAGEMQWQIAPSEKERGGVWIVKVQTDFGGVLPDLRKVQTSRVSARGFSSLGYAEGDGRRVAFETLVDRRTGLLTVRQGRDEASEPLVTDVHDPVSLLVWLRFAGDIDRGSVPLVGGHALVRRLADVDVAGVPGRAFEIRPGGALVAVEKEAPNRLLRLVQPTDFGPIEATLRDERRGKDREKRRRGR